MALVTRIREGAGLPEKPMLSLALRSWVGSVEAAALDWLSNRQISRDVLVGYLSDTLAHAVVAATSIDLQGGSWPPRGSTKKD